MGGLGISIPEYKMFPNFIILEKIYYGTQRCKYNERQ
jgi:hypothetical protein